MPAPLQITTTSREEYCYFPNNSGLCRFRVRAEKDAYIALSTSASAIEPMYQIYIGGWSNTKTAIRKEFIGPEKVSVGAPGLLKSDEFRGFWVRWSYRNVSVGREGEYYPFINWNDSEDVPINYVGICTGRGVTGTWIIEPPYTN